MSFRDRTKLMYANAMEEMLQTTPFEKLRIKDLCEKCGADRQNFYYHFRDKYDLVTWIYGQDFFASVYEQGEQLSVELLTAVMQKIKKRQQFYQIVLSDTSQNSLRIWLHKFNVELCCKSLMRYTGIESLSDEQMFIITHSFYGWLGNVTEWLNNGCMISPEKFAEMQYKAFPEILRKAYTN